MVRDVRKTPFSFSKTPSKNSFLDGRGGEEAMEEKDIINRSFRGAESKLGEVDH